MDRRRFLLTSLAGGLAAGAPAQISASQVRVGVLVGAVAPAALRESSVFLALRDALAHLGYREGQNLVLEARSAERQTELPALAEELVQLKVGVIVAGGVAAAKAAKAATQTIPIVGVGVGGDPIAMGLAQSIQHPGGNFTGFLHAGTDVGKMLQLLQEALPRFTRVGVVWNSDNPVTKDRIGAWEDVMRARGVSPRLMRATRIEELDVAFATLAAEKISAVVVITDALWFVQSKRAAEVGLRHRVDGAKPGDLPLQYPSRWTLVVNLKAAKAIGVTLSSATLNRADRVIE